MMRLWAPVKVNGHVDEVLAVLKGEAPPSTGKAANTKTKKKTQKKKKKK